MPFLAGLLKDGAARLVPWRAMLPTSTSAFQAGLFYGDNADIPGFFWLDKRSGQVVRMNGLEDTARVEERIRARVAPYAGLLAGGSSYSALFAGGARYTFMTFSRMFSPRLNLSTSWRMVLLFALSQAMSLLRIAWYSIVELALALYDLAVGLFKSRNKFLEFRFLFPRVASVVFCRELATLATVLDVYRGVGPIYVNHFAYDEHAHHRGPRSRFAFWTLKGLDASIRRVGRAIDYARERGIREYDLYVWSDHGQVATAPFHERMEQDPERHFDLLFRTFYGRTDAQRREAERRHAAERIERGRIVRGPRRRRALHHERAAGRIEHIEGAFPVGVRRVVKTMARPAREAAAREARKYPLDPEHRVRVVTTGPVANLYLMDTVEPIAYETWRESYPHFIDAVAAHQALGFALARRADGGCMAGCAGAWFALEDDAAMRQACPALVLGVLQQRREEFRRWANMPSAGDLILFGLGAGDGEASVSFSYEYGGHAGPSQEETTPFILLPTGGAARWPEAALRQERPVLTLEDLHRAFREAYQGDGESAERLD
jgi:hypothetical protein